MNLKTCLCNTKRCLCGYAGLALTLKEQRELYMFENRVLKELHGPQTEEETDGESCILQCLMIFTPPPTLFVDETDEKYLARALEKYGRKVHAGFWWRNMKERDHLKDVSESERC